MKKPVLIFVAAMLAGKSSFVLPALAKTEAECKAEIAQKYPPGTLSKKAGSRDALIRACVKGINDVAPVKAGSSSGGAVSEERNTRNTRKCNRGDQEACAKVR